MFILVHSQGTGTELTLVLLLRQPQTEMKDDMKTLEEYGVQGLPKIPPPNPNASIGGVEMGVGEAPSPEVKEKAEVVFWYDFKPFTHDDPLLLR